MRKSETIKALRDFELSYPDMLGRLMRIFSETLPFDERYVLSVTNKFNDSFSEKERSELVRLRSRLTY